MTHLEPLPPVAVVRSGFAVDHDDNLLPLGNHFEGKPFAGQDCGFLTLTTTLPSAKRLPAGLSWELLICASYPLGKHRFERSERCADEDAAVALVVNADFGTKVEILEIAACGKEVAGRRPGAGENTIDNAPVVRLFRCVFQPVRSRPLKRATQLSFLVPAFALVRLIAVTTATVIKVHGQFIGKSHDNEGTRLHWVWRRLNECGTPCEFKFSNRLPVRKQRAA